MKWCAQILSATFAISSLVVLPSVTVAAEKMNVLLIISDDLRTELGCYASTLAKTPHIDRLAQTGVLFEHAYCQVPLCCPSRSSMLTGRKPGTTGVLGNRCWFGDAHPDFISLPKYFKQNGYTTVRSGKIFHGGIDDTEAWSVNGQVRKLAGVPPSAGGSLPPRKKAERKQPIHSEEPDDQTRTNEQWFVLPGNGEGHGDFNTTNRTIAALRQYKDVPFFIGCGFINPHTPLKAPQSSDLTFRA